MKVMINESGIVSTIERQEMWLQEIDRKHILYFGCYTGLGKTSQALYLAESHYENWVRFSGETDNLCGKVEKWMSNNDGKKRLIIVDNISYLHRDEDKKQQVVEVIKKKIEMGSFDLIIIGRAECPTWMNYFRGAGLIKCYGVENFILNNKEVDELIDYQLSSSAKVLNADSRRWLAKKKIEIRAFSYGVPIRVMLSSELIKQSGNSEADISDKLKSIIGNYYEERVIQNFSDFIILCAMKMSVFDEFCDVMVMEMLGKEGFDKFSKVIEYSSFITRNNEGVYSINKSFRWYMCDRFRDMNQLEYINNLEKAAQCCERNRLYAKALELYAECNDKNSLANLLIYMSKNGDGCPFPRECNKYLDCFKEEEYLNKPELLGARAMIESFHMRVNNSNNSMEILKELASKEKEQHIHGGVAQRSYIRTLFTLPHRKSTDFATIINQYIEIFIGENESLSDFTVTGGGPSVINGSFDLMGWLNKQPDLYEFLKQTIPVVIGKKGLGFADIAIGEYYLETGNRLKAISSLITAISIIRENGNVKALYAANAIMARSFLEDKKIDVAKDLLENMYIVVKDSEYPEIKENVRASQAELNLYDGDMEKVEEWIEFEVNYGVGRPIGGDFFVSDRYRLFVLAKAYIALENYINAAVIIHQLLVYAKRYERKYLMIKLHILDAVLSEAVHQDGTQELKIAVKMAMKYGYIRIVADEGSAITNIWDKIDWGDLNKKEKILWQKIKKEMDMMARQYPNYLKRGEAVEFSKKEQDVFYYMYEGYTNEQIADKMNIKLTTAKFHVSNILKKIGVKNRQEAIRWSVENGLFVNK